MKIWNSICVTCAHVIGYALTVIVTFTVFLMLHSFLPYWLAMVLTFTIIGCGAWYIGGMLRMVIDAIRVLKQVSTMAGAV